MILEKRSSINSSAAYETGLTPNPCIDCNRYMKFDKLYERAKILGCDHIATGHYARITQENGLYQLRKAYDETKDQSYVLYDMTQERLSQTLFPLGELRKSEARGACAPIRFYQRRQAGQSGHLLCPGWRLREDHRASHGKKAEPGNFVDKNGNVLGRHNGIIRYTIGQHRGLGLSLSQKYFVCEIRPDSTTRSFIGASGTDLLPSRREGSGYALDRRRRRRRRQASACKAKLRYRHPEQPVSVMVLDERRNPVIEFDEPQRAPTPGQYAVLYDGDIVLGGGVIAGTFAEDTKEAGV